MALQGTIEDVFGVTHNEAYAKVVLTNINWLNFIAEVVVNIYHNRNCRETGKQPIAQRAYQFTSNFQDYFLIETLNQQGKNVTSQVYAYVKTLGEWDGWIDI